jgi:hypothetical protein
MRWTWHIPRVVVFHMDVRPSNIIVKLPSQNTALSWNFHNDLAGSHIHVEDLDAIRTRFFSQKIPAE